MRGWCAQLHEDTGIPTDQIHRHRRFFDVMAFNPVLSDWINQGRTWHEVSDWKNLRATRDAYDRFEEECDRIDEAAEAARIRDCMQKMDSVSLKTATESQH